MAARSAGRIGQAEIRAEGEAPFRHKELRGISPRGFFVFYALFAAERNSESARSLREEGTSLEAKAWSLLVEAQPPPALMKATSTCVVPSSISALQVAVVWEPAFWATSATVGPLSLVSFCLDRMVNPAEVSRFS